jgi:membrane dipeptidase
VVRECGRLGIIPDVSHASEACANDILEEADRTPVVATHSDSYTVYPHSRNLSDTLFSEIRKREGLVGINLYCEHLGYGTLRGSEIDVTLRHIEYFLSLDGEDVLCFGCDFDGARTPPALQHPRDLTYLAEEMLRRGYPSLTIEKLFWKNAKRFLIKNIFNSIS